MGLCIKEYPVLLPSINLSEDEEQGPPSQVLQERVGWGTWLGSPCYFDKENII